MDFTDGAPLPSDAGVVANRLLRDAVLSSLAQFEAIFLREMEEEETEAQPEDQTENLRAALMGSWLVYAEQAGADSSAMGYRTFLETDLDQSESLACVNGLRNLFVQLVMAGLTPAELDRCKTAILPPITPQIMEPIQMEDLIGVDGLGLEG